MLVLSQDGLALVEVEGIQIRSEEVKVGQNSRLFSSPEPVTEIRHQLVATGSRSASDSLGFSPAEIVLGSYKSLKRAKEELSMLARAIQSGEKVYFLSRDPESRE